VCTFDIALSASIRVRLDLIIE